MPSPDCTWDKTNRAVCDCGGGVFSRTSVVDSLGMLMPYLALDCLTCSARWITTLDEPRELILPATFIEGREAAAHRFRRKREIIGRR